MAKKEKIGVLSIAMASRLSHDGNSTQWYFTDGGKDSFEAIKELKDLFLEHYSVRDIDYRIFSEALDMLEDIYASQTKGKNFVENQIYARSSDRASVYTGTRLEYLSAWNEDEVSKVMTTMALSSIAEACAIWYDKQVEQAAIIINKWITL